MSPAVAHVAVVTGAASGIGRATALRVAGDGYIVAMMDIDPAGLAATPTAIEQAGGTAHGFTVDLRDPHSVGSVTREVAVDIGPPYLLVNVAGIGIAATVLETSDEDWDRVLSINLTGPFLTTRAILPLMLDRGSGVVINIASVGGQVGLARRAAYCASKAGLVGLTRAVAVDHARDGIRCVAICPGTVETEWIGKILVDAPDPAAAREPWPHGNSTDDSGPRTRSLPWSPSSPDRTAGSSTEPRWSLCGGMTAA